MKVQVIDKSGSIIKAFEVPPGFQLEKYVQTLYPNEDTMGYTNSIETNISVLSNYTIVEIYRGIFI